MEQHPHYLQPVFCPKSVALFGATPNAPGVGATLSEHLLQGGFQGRVFAINPKYKEVLGKPCYPALDTINEPVDLAVITTPADTVPGIIRDCGEAGVKAAVILTAGFREVGSKGQALEKEVVELARHHGIRLVGPNCLGVIRPELGFNATFSRGDVIPGSLALVSQSGAICTAILDWAESSGVGFSSVISLGASADLDFGEVLDFLVSDQQTRAILLYIEGVENARSFMSGLRAAASVKPVVALKVGRHQAAGIAAKSHTGAMVGNDAVFDAALQRAGIVRGQRINDLFVAATVLSRNQQLAGENLLIVTNGGGPGAMACDRASDLGIPLATLADATVKKLDEVLPPTWSKQNPVDIIGDAGPDRYRAALSACLDDSQVHAVLVILAPTALNDPTAVATVIQDLGANSRKPILACWMGGQQVAAGSRLLTDARIPCFRTPESAIDAYGYLLTFYRNQHLLSQVPEAITTDQHPDISGARLIVESVLADNRDTLTELEAKALLAAFRIPVNRTAIAHDIHEALMLAESIGFPIAMKVHSKDISHKSDVGGVKVGLENAGQIRGAYKEIIDNCRRAQPDARIDGVTVQAMQKSPNGREVLLGTASDPLFGPVISFGTGGTGVEVVQDQALALPPLNNLLAEDLINRTRISRQLAAYRHIPAANRKALVEVLLRLSEMVCELPWIREVDINPLIVDETGVMAVDARVVVGHGRYQLDRYSHLAIHPYPAQFSSQFQHGDGTNITIRPIRPEDATIEQDFVRGLSRQSKYMRFMQNLKELTPAMLRRFTQIDYDREMALIAVVHLPEGDREIGVSRYVTNPDGDSCEFAVVVADEWQGKGLAWRLMEQLITIARHRGLEEMEGTVLADNYSMLKFCRDMGFKSEHLPEDSSVVSVVKRLQKD